MPCLGETWPSTWRRGSVRFPAKWFSSLLSRLKRVASFSWCGIVEFDQQCYSTIMRKMKDLELPPIWGIRNDGGEGMNNQIQPTPAAKKRKRGLLVSVKHVALRSKAALCMSWWISWKLLNRFSNFGTTSAINIQQEVNTLRGELAKVQTRIQADPSRPFLFGLNVNLKESIELNESNEDKMKKTKECVYLYI